MLELRRRIATRIGVYEIGVCAIGHLFLTVQKFLLNSANSDRVIFLAELLSDTNSATRGVIPKMIASAKNENLVEKSFILL